MRDRILKGELRRDECTNEDIFEFLMLLERTGVNNNNTAEYRPITCEKWKIVIK